MFRRFLRNRFGHKRSEDDAAPGWERGFERGAGGGTRPRRELRYRGRYKNDGEECAPQPEFTFTPIGVIHSPFHDKEQTPIQPTHSQAPGFVDILPEFADGLQDLEGFSHIILIYVFHQSSGYDLKVRPFLDDRLHGLFATRYPRRPNPLGLSIVELVRRDGPRLEIAGVDVLDGTPLLDIKPYVPEFDIREVTRVGWYATRSKQER